MEVRALDFGFEGSKWLVEPSSPHSPPRKRRNNIFSFFLKGHFPSFRRIVSRPSQAKVRVPPHRDRNEPDHSRLMNLGGDCSPSVRSVPFRKQGIKRERDSGQWTWTTGWCGALSSRAPSRNSSTATSRTIRRLGTAGRLRRLCGARLCCGSQRMKPS